MDAFRASPGTAEEVLIEFLQDNKNSLHDRDHVAIWTLGQIHSQKALPLLRLLYKDDPEGITCKGKHHLVICQYELHKAIIAAELKRWPLHARLNK